MIQTELIADWPASLQMIVAGYLANHGLDDKRLCRADLALVLLRVADGAADAFVKDMALDALAKLTGGQIKKCPSAMPPWPPKPVHRAPRLVFTRVVTPYPGHAGTEMAQRYSLLKPGMTKEQALAKGVTTRDVRYWTEQGHVELAER